MFRKKRKSGGQTQILQESLSLSLSAMDDKVSLEFPAELVNDIRNLITRLTYKNLLSSRISLVSALRQEGVTYISRAFATTLAHDLQVSVCLVELNWWWPDQAAGFDKFSGGLAAVLENKTSLNDVIIQTNHPNLVILPSGKIPLEDRPVWARSPRLQETITDLAQQYDHLIFDIPAILATNDAIPLASLADTCCLVINQGVTPLENTKQAMGEISHLSIAGVVMNKVHIHTPNWILKYLPQGAGSLNTV